MTDKPKFYIPSQTVHVLNLVIAIGAGLICAILLAYLYNLFSTFIPIIYFNVIITIGFGMSLGFAIRIISRLTKLTNRKSRLILTMVTVMSAFLFQWIAFLGTLNTGFAPSFGVYLSDISAILFGGVNWSSFLELYEYGAWSIGGIMFNKLLLLLVWIAELLIVIAIPSAMISKSNEYPFSESSNRWYPKYTLSDQFESMASKRYFLDEYSSNILGGVQNLKMGEGWRHGKIHIFYLKEENDSYLSFEKVFIQGRGKGKKTSHYLIENMRLSNQEAKSILNEFHHDRERFEVF